MVKVVTDKLGSQTTRGQAPVFQSPNVPSGAFDSGASGLTQSGQQLGDFSDQLEAIAIQQVREDNETEFKELDNRVYEAVRIATYGDPDTGAEGYYSKQNQQALNEYATVEELMRAEVSTIVAESSNERVKQMVLEKSRERVRDAVSGMTRHAEQQRLNYMNQTGEAREALAFDGMVKAYNDPVTRQKSLNTIKVENDDWARRNGVDPSSDVAEARLLERQGTAMKGAFDAAMAAENIIAAESILAEAKARGTADQATITQMEKGLKTETLAKRSQVVADEARRRYPGDVEKQVEYARNVASGKVRNGALDLIDAAFRRARQVRQEKEAEATDTRAARSQEVVNKVEDQFSDVEDPLERDQLIMRELRSTLSGKDEEAALNLYRERQSDREGLEKEARVKINQQHTVDNRERNKAVDQANQKAHAFLYGTPHEALGDLPASTPRSVSEFRRLFPDDYNTLVAGKAGSNQDFVEALRRRERDIQVGKLFAVSTDGTTLRTLRQRNLRDRANADLDALRNKLTETEYAEATRLVASAKDRIAANGAKLQSYNFGDAELKKHGRNVFGFGKGQKVKTKLFSDASALMSSFVYDYYQRTGEVPPPTELTKEAIRLTLQVESDPDGGTVLWGVFGNEENNALPSGTIAAQARNMSPQQRREAIVPKDAIPDSIVQQVTDTFFKRGLATVSEDDLQEFAGAIAMRDKTRMQAILGRAKARNNANPSNTHIELTNAERTAMNAVFGGDN